MMAFAPLTVQCMPARLRRAPITTLHPASRTPVRCTNPGRETLGSACERDCERCTLRIWPLRRRKQHGVGAVSYTHLRAHETGRNLVCRLLLEKKKKIQTTR